MNPQLKPTLHPVETDRFLSQYSPLTVALAASDGRLILDAAGRLGVRSAADFALDQARREGRL